MGKMRKEIREKRIKRLERLKSTDKNMVKRLMKEIEHKNKRIKKLKTL